MKKSSKLIGAVVVALFAYFVFFGGKMDQTTMTYLVFGAALLCAWTGWSTTTKGKASTKWPRTHGVIRKSGVAVSRSASGGSRGASTNHTFEVEYEYEVDGKVFTNNVYSYQINYNAARQKGARELVGRFPEGSVVDVYYDPRKPKNSVLLPGVNTWSYVPFLAALFLMAFGVSMYLDQS